MAKHRTLEFPCRTCKYPVTFVMEDLSAGEKRLACTSCEHTYDFSEETLQAHLGKFITLCQTLRESEEILSDASIGVDVGPHHVQVPYRLLLTRLGSTLNLTFGNETLPISFRHEPARDLAIQESQ